MGIWGAAKNGGHPYFFIYRNGVIYFMAITNKDQQALQIYKEIDKITREEWLSLKNAAQELLINLLRLNSQKQHIQMFLQSQEVLLNKIIQFKKYMQQDAESTRQILKYIREFQIALNNYLGREIYLNYVEKETGNIFVFNEFYINQIYQLSSKGSEGRGKINSSSAIKELFKQIENRMSQSNLPSHYKSIVQNIKKSQKERKKIYIRAYQRFLEKRNNYMFYWHNPLFRKRQYSNRYYRKWGDVAEAYAGAVINENPKFLEMNEGLEELNRLASNHDSIPGILKGDIIFDKDIDIQFAVKQGNFSTEAVDQYIKTAIYILTNDSYYLDKETFLKNITILLKTSWDKLDERVIKKGKDILSDKIINQNLKI